MLSEDANPPRGKNARELESTCASLRIDAAMGYHHGIPGLKTAI